MGDFVEARRRLIQKLENCENTHQDMLRERLASRGVNVENYVRLNVEVGVGEFGMNEWARLSEIDTNTRTYLARRDVEELNHRAAAKLAKVHFAKQRFDRAEARNGGSVDSHGMPRYSWQNSEDRPLPLAEPANSNAVELPGDDMWYQTQGFRPGAQQYEHRPSIAGEKYTVVSGEFHLPQHQRYPSDATNPSSPPHRPVQPYQGGQNRDHSNSLSSNNGLSPRTSYEQRSSPPPIPPKMPMQGLPYPDESNLSPTSPPGNGPRTFQNMGDLRRGLPYPDVEGPPPTVNTANKPQLSR